MGCPHPQVALLCETSSLSSSSHSKKKKTKKKKKKKKRRMLLPMFPLMWMMMMLLFQTSLDDDDLSPLIPIAMVLNTTRAPHRSSALRQAVEYASDLHRQWW